jgi:hypothetical protein
MMMNLSSRKRMLALAAPVLAVAVGLAAGQRTASGAGAEEDKAALNERCATRLSIAFIGKSAPAAELASANPQGAVDALLASPDFLERFARFTNSKMNDDPGEAAKDDSAYHLSKYILTNNKPWGELFNGPYNVDLDAAKTNVVVTDDPNGVGYFRSRPWMVRYAGNELAGIKIGTAYRIQNNVVGLTLVASTNAPEADISMTGRKAQPCSQCHYESWYALDNIASILSKRVGLADKMTFGPQSAPEADLGGTKIHNDKELVDTLVNSDAFKFRTCRLAFNFLYGRDENKCEGTIFDKCIDEFSTKKTIQSAIAAVAKDPSFCQ